MLFFKLIMPFLIMFCLPRTLVFSTRNLQLYAKTSTFSDSSFIKRMLYKNTGCDRSTSIVLNNFQHLYFYLCSSNFNIIHVLLVSESSLCVFIKGFTFLLTYFHVLDSMSLTHLHSLYHTVQLLLTFSISSS